MMAAILSSHSNQLLFGFWVFVGENWREWERVFDKVVGHRSLGVFKQCFYVGVFLGTSDHLVDYLIIDISLIVFYFYYTIVLYVIVVHVWGCYNYHIQTLL